LGCDGGAGNPPDPQGRNYRTAYLWEEVLQRDSLLDLLARFLHLQIDERITEDGKALSRLNRTHSLKEDTFILDFVNERQEIQEAFKQFYEGAIMSEEVAPERLYEIKTELDASGIYLGEQVARFCEVYFKPKERQSAADHKAMYAWSTTGFKRSVKPPSVWQKVSIDAQEVSQTFKRGAQSPQSGWNWGFCLFIVQFVALQPQKPAQVQRPEVSARQFCAHGDQR
jgi:type I site-specific restriction-modification system R (restriction) subunit